MKNEDLTFEEREIIINQIERIKEISDLKNKSICIDLILNLYLTLSKDYLLCAMTYNEIIKRLDIKDAKKYIKSNIDLLVKKNILTKKNNLFELNPDYFIENDI